jgi:hypothetical protein
VLEMVDRRGAGMWKWLVVGSEPPRYLWLVVGSISDSESEVLSPELSSAV